MKCLVSVPQSLGRGTTDSGWLASGAAGAAAAAAGQAASSLTCLGAVADVPLVRTFRSVSRSPFRLTACWIPSCLLLLVCPNLHVHVECAPRSSVPPLAA